MLRECQDRYSLRSMVVPGQFRHQLDFLRRLGPRVSFIMFLYCSWITGDYRGLQITDSR
jgi:hypothetical protein